jgi:CheY-like chemotaxis protein
VADLDLAAVALVSEAVRELRSPLAGLLGMAGLLLDTTLGREQREYGLAMQAAARRSLGLLDRLQDFGLLAGGALTADPTTFSPRTLLEQVIEGEATEGTRGVDLVLHAAQDLPDTVVGDARRWQRVVSDVVRFALRTTVAGQVVVSARVQPADRGGTLDVVVTDTGPGWTDAQVGALYAPAAGPDTQATGGPTGWWLDRLVLEQLGGVFDVRSDQRVGTEVTCRIPVQVASSGNPRLFATGSTVLVIARSGATEAALADDLTSLGARVASASSSWHALELIGQADSNGDVFTLVVLDERLEGVGPRTLRRLLEQHPSTRGRPVVLVGDPQVGQPARSAPGVAHVPRPARRSALARAIAGVLTAPAARPRPQDAHAPAAPPLSRRVLIVDDDPISRTVAARLVERAGGTADTATNGREAIEAAELIRYDLVLLDCQMPVMDGFEAAIELRSRQRRGARVPIVALTAYDEPEDRARCVQAGFDEILRKPLTRGEVERMFATYVRPAGFGAPGGDAPPIDLESATGNIGGDDDTVRQVLELLAVDAPRLVGEVRQLAARRRHGRALHCFESLKSALSLVAAGDAYAAAVGFERTLREDDLGARATALATLEEHVDALCEYIRKH